MATIIPVVTDHFQSLDDVGWYASAFLLASASSQLIYGKLYRVFAIKNVFAAAVLLFAVGSLLCALSPTSNVFILGRAFSGIGSAGILAGSNIIISQSVPVRQRPLYLSMVAAIECIAISIGPLLGGIITTKLSWRWCFWICLPVAGVTMAITLTLFKSQGSSDEILLPLRDKLIQLDLLSLIILIPTVVCLVLGLQWGGITYSWNDWRIILLFVLFGCLAITFGIVQWWQGDRATVPPRILLTRHILFGAWYSFNTSGALYVAAYYVS